MFFKICSSSLDKQTNPQKWLYLAKSLGKLQIY